MWTSDFLIFTLRCSRLEVRAVLSPTSVPWTGLQATAAEEPEGGPLLDARSLQTSLGYAYRAGALGLHLQGGCRACP